MLAGHFHQFERLVLFIELVFTLLLSGFGLLLLLAIGFAGSRLHLLLVFIYALLDPLGDQLGLLLGLPRLLVGTGNLHRLLLGFWGNLVVFGHLLSPRAPMGWESMPQRCGKKRLAIPRRRILRDHS